MAIVVAAGAIKAMGFRAFEAGESLTVTFTRILVYEARGITLQVGSNVGCSGTIDGVAFKLQVAESLNAACNAVTQNDFIENEAQWKQEKGTNGPFLLVQLGPTQPYTIFSGNCKNEENGSISTYDSFPMARTDLEAKESTAIPRILSSITFSLGGPGRPVDPKFLIRINFGNSTSGKVVHDFRLQGSGNAYLSHSITDSELDIGIQSVITNCQHINTKAARFFALGLKEKDELKQFLYMFLSIEISTHAVFGQINQSTAIQNLLTPGHQSNLPLSALLLRQSDQLKNLFDRFVWCACHSWHGIGESEISEFKNLKTIRDNIAHGTISEPPPGSAQKVQSIAQMILSN